MMLWCVSFSHMYLCDNPTPGGPTKTVRYRLIKYKYGTKKRYGTNTKIRIRYTQG